ncbi:glycoside hydrolase family 20 zincin-like fold domain-containing protein, partial [Bacteroides heparinolyticus]
MIILKNIRLLMAVAALLSSVSSVSSVRAEVNPKPFTIPELKGWKGAEGHFDLNAQTLLAFDASNPDVAEVANMFADDCRLMFGFSPRIQPGAKTKGSIRFRLESKPDQGREGYRVRIADRIEVSASNATGLYMATRTLLQIAEQDGQHRLPKGTITDSPDYDVRGFMIDCGRKFIPMAYLKDLLKVMAYYKMNTLQVHLNDNGFKEYFENDWNKTYAAFRLECDTYPGL